MDDLKASASLINIDSFVDQHGSGLTHGTQLDSLHVWLAFNYLDMGRRFETVVEFITSKPDLWSKFAADATRVMLELGQSLLIAHYEADEACGLHRFYCLRVAALDRDLANNLWNPLKDNAWIMTEDAIRYFCCNSTNLDRYKTWLNKQEDILAPFRRVADGRLANTAVAQVRVFYGQHAGCVSCNNPATGFVGSTFGGQVVFLYIAAICSEHKKIAEQYPTNLHFIFNLFGMTPDLGDIPMQENLPADIIPFIAEAISGALQAVRTSVSMRSEKTHLLKFYLRSGFHVVLRLTRLLDYAYIVFAPDGSEYRKIDSATHHESQLQFSPDHLHLAPGKDNKDVVSSYTYGNPLFDLPLIQRLVEEGEREWGL